MPDKASVVQWVRTWNKHLVRFLSSRGATKEEAEDFAQEAYLRLLRRDDLDLVTNPQAYLYTIAGNLYTEWRGKAAQSRDHSADPLMDLTGEAEPQLDAELQDDRQQVTQALSALPSMTRQVLLLHIQQEMTYQQIATHLQLSHRSVKRHILNGYATLRQLLGPSDTRRPLP